MSVTVVPMTRSTYRTPTRSINRGSTLGHSAGTSHEALGLFLAKDRVGRPDGFLKWCDEVTAPDGEDFRKADLNENAHERGRSLRGDAHGSGVRSGALVASDLEYLRRPFGSVRAIPPLSFPRALPPEDRGPGTR
jgi:hypothetical protein